MSNAATIFSVDSPRTVAKLRDKILERKDDLYGSLRDAASWEVHQRFCGGLDELDVVLSILSEIELQENR